MAPERVAKKFRKLYGRCARELDRFEEADSLASSRLRKVMTIRDRWSLLEQEDLYLACDDALSSVGLKEKVVAKQARVLQASVADLEEAL